MDRADQTHAEGRRELLLVGEKDARPKELRGGRAPERAIEALQVLGPDEDLRYVDRVGLASRLASCDERDELLVAAADAQQQHVRAEDVAQRNRPGEEGGAGHEEE